MNEVFILLGSNRGNREELLSGAMEMISAEAGTIRNRSSVYETQPWGFDDPIPFLNQAIEISTDLNPNELLENLLKIETRVGRIRPVDGCGCSVAGNYEGRTIDLDILFYGQKLVFTDSLMIPHPRLHERRFCLLLLNEIAPDFIHPLLKKTISVLLQGCPDQSKVEKINKS
jgi:2-amino-4-hydroxy-6-hydroxymethyldihydropteridine diphosphokinase